MTKLIKQVFNIGLVFLILGLGVRIGMRMPFSTLNPKYPIIQVNPKSLDQVKHFIVLISNEGLMGVSRGTGVIIDSTHVLTCAHLMPQADQEMWLYTYPTGTVLK